MKVEFIRRPEQVPVMPAPVRADRLLVGEHLPLDVLADPRFPAHRDPI